MKELIEKIKNIISDYQHDYAKDNYEYNMFVDIESDILSELEKMNCDNCIYYYICSQEVNQCDDNNNERNLSVGFCSGFEPKELKNEKM